MTDLATSAPMAVERLAGVRRAIEASCREAKRDPATVTWSPSRRLRCRRDRAGDRRRSAGVRREPRAGGQGEMAGLARTRTPASSFISSGAAVEQGARRRWRCSMRSIPSIGRASREALAKEIARQGRNADAVRRGQYRCRTAKSRGLAAMRPTLSCGSAASAMGSRSPG